MRVDKLLSELNYATRKESKIAAKKRQITVDGKICKDVSIHVDPLVQSIVFKDEVIVYKERIYIMMNKPKGVVSAVSDDVHTTVCDLLFPQIRQNLFPVGRLDIDTTGLLLLTNDGNFSHKLIHSKQGIDKTYLVNIKNPLSKEDISLLQSGIVLDGEQLQEATVLLKDEHTLLLTIKEGKYHQVKRMLQAVKNEVVELKRVSIANLELDDSLLLGEFRELTEDDFIKLGIPSC